MDWWWDNSDGEVVGKWIMTSSTRPPNRAEMLREMPCFGTTIGSQQNVNVYDCFTCRFRSRCAQVAELQRQFVQEVQRVHNTPAAPFFHTEPEPLP